MSREREIRERAVFLRTWAPQASKLTSPMWHVTLDKEDWAYLLSMIDELRERNAELEAQVERLKTGLAHQLSAENERLAKQNKLLEGAIKALERRAGELD